jgi:hypothetical protein
MSDLHENVTSAVSTVRTPAYVTGVPAACGFERAAATSFDRSTTRGFGVGSGTGVGFTPRRHATRARMSAMVNLDYPLPYSGRGLFRQRIDASPQAAHPTPSW